MNRDSSKNRMISSRFFHSKNVDKKYRHCYDKYDTVAAKHLRDDSSQKLFNSAARPLFSNTYLSLDAVNSIKTILRYYLDYCSVY